MQRPDAADALLMGGFATDPVDCGVLRHDLQPSPDRPPAGVKATAQYDANEDILHDVLRGGIGPRHAEGDSVDLAPVTAGQLGRRSKRQSIAVLLALGSWPPATADCVTA